MSSEIPTLGAYRHSLISSTFFTQDAIFLWDDIPEASARGSLPSQGEYPPLQLLSFSIGVISYLHPPYWSVTRDVISLSPNCDSCNAWNASLSSLWLPHFLPSYLFFSLTTTMGSQPHLHLARFLPSLSDLIVLALMFSKKLFR